MDGREELPELVGELGEALVRALAEDPECRLLAHQIQALGFGLALSLEASPLGHEEDAEPLEGWSEEDRRMMKSFRISLD